MEQSKIHYVNQKGWIGDPNGLVYLNNVYHLFYQYEPKMNVFTPDMHWGHATSTDLLNWTNYGIAIYPDELGAIWSGSAVVDTDNTAGFGKNAIICIYTSAGGETYESVDKQFTISIAYSNDGIKFHKYQNNPVIENIVVGNRDPKVFWHDKSKKWIIIFCLPNQKENLCIMSSTNLKNWETIQKLNIDGLEDCPDMFPLINNNSEKYVIMSTNGKYVIGTFDGSKFTQETEIKQFAFGDTYASQTWNNVTNKRICMFRLGDMENSEEICQMSLPIELSLNGQNIITCKPITNAYFENAVQTICWNNKYIDNEHIELTTPVFDLEMTFEKTDGISSIELIDGIIEYDNNTNKLTYNKKYSIECTNNKNNLHIISDVHSIEIFVNNEQYIGCFQYGNAFSKIKFNNINIIDMCLSQKIEKDN
jgi:sucrose-6-phosphate hydrolase SacC (GH32 family)